MHKFERYFSVVLAVSVSAVSMLMTANFAYSFTADGFWANVCGIILGGIVDLAKLGLWFARHRCRFYGYMSLVLMLVSCLASYMASINFTDTDTEKYRQQTHTYQSVLMEIENLEKDEKALQGFVDLHKNSQYHDQWEKGEEIVEELREIRRKKKELKARLATIGAEEARKMSQSSALFVLFSDMTGMSFEKSRKTLCLFFSSIFEVLGLTCVNYAGKMLEEWKMIKAKTDTEKEVRELSKPQFVSENTETVSNSDTDTPTHTERPLRLSLKQLKTYERIRRDIISGETYPINRRNIAKKYSIRFEEARDILELMLSFKELRKRGNSYRVNPERLNDTTNENDRHKQAGSV